MPGLAIPLNVGSRAIGGAGLLGTLGSIAGPVGAILTLGSLLGGLFGGDEEPRPLTWREQMQANAGPLNRNIYPALQQMSEAYRQRSPQPDFIQYLQKFL